MSLGSPGDEIEDEAQDGAFRLNHEPQALPGRWAHQALNKSRPQPPADAEREQRAGRETDHRVAEAKPLTEDEPPEKSGDLSRNGREHHLQCLKPDEDQAGEGVPTQEDPAGLLQR